MSDETIDCPYCASEWPAHLEMRFCGECGSKLGALSPVITDRERRNLTVLFADLAGFSLLSATADPEAVESIVDDLLTDLGEVVDEYDGYVDKYLGDAVMAVFGAPTAHEDDPFRAVSAGIDMVEIVEGATAEYDRELSISVGINTGDVLWSKVGGGDFTVTGDAVNVAKRLEAAAADDTVLVSDSVRERTSHRIQYSDHEAVAVDGRETPVQTAVVDGIQRTDESAGDPSATDRPPFSGREAELNRLRSVIDQPEPSFVAVTGEAGIGKSRLLEATRTQLEGSGATVLVGHCTQHGETSLEPFVELLLSRAETDRSDPNAPEAIVRSVLADLGDRHDRIHRENVANLLALSAGFEPPEDRVTDLPAERLQAEIRRAWETWIESLAGDDPALVQIEDLQWADNATIELLTALHQSLTADDLSASITMACTLRPSGTVPEGFETIELTPLSEEHTRTIASGVLGGPIDDGLLTHLQEHAAGNPYFLTELLRYLRDRGLLAAASGHSPADASLDATDGYSLADSSLDAAGVPETLNGLLVGRIDALPPDASETLKGASVVGERFWRDHLEETLDRAVREPIAGLERFGMVWPHEESTVPADSEYAFEHALLRDAAYGLLPSATRRDLHERAADCFEAIGRAAESMDRRTLSLAARQADIAGDSDRAGALWTEIAEVAVEANAFQEAIAYAERACGTVHDTDARLTLAQVYRDLGQYDRTLNILDEFDAATSDGTEDVSDDQRYRALVLRAEVFAERGENDRAIDVAETVIEESSDDTLVFRAARSKAVALKQTGEYDRARTALSEAQVILDGLEDTVSQEIEIARQIGNVATRQGDLDEATEQYEWALERARAREDRFAAARVLKGYGGAAYGRGKYETAIEYWEEALEIFQEHNARDDQGGVLNNLGVAFQHLGELDAATARYEAALECNRETESKHSTGHTLNNLATLYLDRNEFDTATEYARECIEIREEINDRYGLSNIHQTLGRIARKRGDLDDAKRQIEHSLDIAEEIGNRKAELTNHDELGRIALLRGDYETAREYLEEARDVAQELEALEREAEAWYNLGRLARETGEFETADGRFQRALGMARETGHSGRQALALAALATLDGRRDNRLRANERFEEAIQTASGDGTLLDILRESDIGGVVDVCDRRGQDDIARQWCDRAIDLADRIGADDIRMRFTRRKSNISVQ